MSSHQTPLSTSVDPSLVRMESLSQLPVATWQTLATRRYAKRLPKGLDAFYDKTSSWLVPLLPRKRMALKAAEEVLAMRDAMRAMSDEALQESLQDMRARFRRGREAKADWGRSYAMIREAAWRTLGMEPYRVQVAGAIALGRGSMIEMATGEGKTLVATMPAVVGGWRGRGCHVVTANDYLAARDARELAPLYRFCGLRVAHVDGSMEHTQRRQAYLADVTYCTNKEVAADFLRDRLTLGRKQTLTESLLMKFLDPREQAMGGPDHLVMRGLETAIIDEADSILVDESVTPLIISSEQGDPGLQANYPIAADLALHLTETEHFKVNRKYREVDLTPAGKDRTKELVDAMPELDEDTVGQTMGLSVKAYRRARSVFQSKRLREELVTQALTARYLFLKDQQYVIQDEKVVIVDESTGRLMPDRTWRAGLHQAVEAKERLEVSPIKDTLARISFQRFFRLYRHLSGMSGTLMEAQNELWQVYKVPTFPIPTHKPRIRVQLGDRVFATMKEKNDAIIEEVKTIHQTGRPVLLGTRSVESSEALSAKLTALGLEHEVLNAVRHAEEAQIVKLAGLKGRITVATNMAGRGTDIKLGPGVAELGGLHVIAAERHESLRIDRQLFGRAGRQGDPGSAVVYESLEDELIRRYAPKAKAVNAKVFAKAQARAMRMGRSQRKSVLKNDDWLDEHLGFAGREH